MSSGYKRGTVASAMLGAKRVVVIRHDAGWLGVSEGQADTTIHIRDDFGPVLTDIAPMATVSGSPEKAAAIIRLGASALNDGRSGYEKEVRYLHALADIFESQATPPKPTEPKEFGAKVTARCGTQTRRLRLLRFRTDSTTNAWIDEDHDFNAMAWRWSELSDVTLGWDDESGSS